MNSDHKSLNSFEHTRFDRIYVAKRLFDVAGSIVLIIALLPAMIAVSICISAIVGGPIIYKHRRIGRDGIPFMCWKFRTMVEDADARLTSLLNNDPKACEEWNRTQKFRNDPRIIPGIGRLLRKTSLDELPQLFNVLQGKLTLVGPRPLVEDEIKIYGEAASLFDRALPGLTGLWQVSGRNELTYEERAKLDLYYVNNWSIWLDIYILAKTVFTVLFRHGAK